MDFRFDLGSLILGALLIWLFDWFLSSFFAAQQKKAQLGLDSDLESRLKSTNRELETSRTQSAERHALLAKLETEANELRARLPKLEGFERANADLRLQLQGFDAVKAKLSSAENELSELRLKASEFDALSSRLEGLQGELSALKTKTTGFEGIQAKAALASDLETKVAQFEAEKQVQVKELNAAALKVSDAEAAQQKLRRSLDESVAEVARLRSGMQQFEGLKSRIEELESKGISNEVQAKLVALETELSAYKARVTQLEQSQANFESTRRQMVEPPSVASELASIEAVETIYSQPEVMRKEGDGE